jgi:hypothetical protein
MGCLMDSEKMPTASAAQLYVYAACNHSNPLWSFYASPKSVGLRRRDINVPGTIVLPFHII